MKIYVCTFSDCIIPYKNITYSPSLQDALGHNSLWDGGLILYQRRHKFYFAARLYIWTYRLFWEKMYRTTAMYTEDQFGWIDSPVQQYSTFRINMLFELVLFSIILFFLNPKLCFKQVAWPVVRNKLHCFNYSAGNYISNCTSYKPVQFQSHFHICD